MEKTAIPPAFGADPVEEIQRFIPQDIFERYEIHSYRHAAAILATSAPEELNDLVEALRGFRLTRQMLVAAGGNESEIPKAINKLLRPKGWFETRIHGDLHIALEIYEEQEAKKN